MTILDGFVSSIIFGKGDDFDIVNFPFLDGDIPRAPLYGVYNIFQLIRFARVSRMSVYPFLKVLVEMIFFFLINVRK